MKTLKEYDFIVQLPCGASVVVKSTWEVPGGYSFEDFFHVDYDRDRDCMVARFRVACDLHGPDYVRPFSPWGKAVRVATDVP